MPKEKILRTFTSIQKDDFLRKYQNEISVPSIGNREQEGKPDFLERANWAKAYKHEDQVNDEITYTIPLISSGSEEFGNLVIVKNASTTNSYVLNYIPEKKWLDTKKRRQGFGNFSGIIQMIDLDGEVFSEAQYDNGKIVSNEGINARIAGCRTERVVTGYTTVCFENQCIISEVRFADVEICESTSPSESGDDDSGGDSFGGSGGNYTNPRDLGKPGPLDPEDVSYWLKPLIEGQDLNNPQDGMKAIAPDGTIYTYDADINGWLMPDVTVMEENGFIPQYFFSSSVDFDGGIISTMIIVAVAEPTPIGEIVVGGVLFSLWIYNVYDLMTTNWDQANYDHCQRLYNQCVVQYANKNMPCSSCLQYCRVQKEWDFINCSLR